jgi:NADPH:quinone reductase-like Zn-dependent oxidoreductase
MDPFSLPVGSSARTADSDLIRKGHHPIGVCSPPNFDLVRSRGAEAVFDRSSPTLTADVLAYTGNRLKHIVGCIATAETIAACQACMGRMGGKYVTLEPFPPELLTRKRIAHAWVLQPEILCKPIGWPPPFTRGAAPADMVRWASAWYREVQEYLDQGSLKPHPVELRRGGLQGILEDMDAVRKRQVSAVKFVYQVGT